MRKRKEGDVESPADDAAGLGRPEGTESGSPTERAAGEYDDSGADYVPEADDEYDEQYDDGDGDGDAGPDANFKPPTFLEAVKQVFTPLNRSAARSGAGRSGIGRSGAGRSGADEQSEAGRRDSGNTAGTASTGLLGRARQRAQPATGTEDDRRAVTYIDRRERMIGFFFGAVQIGLGILDYFSYRRYVDTDKKVSAHARAANTLSIHHAAPWVLGIGLVFGLFTVLATFSKRRAALGFVILLGGLELLQSGGGVFGLLYFGVGIWMIFRALKRNKAAAATRPARGSRASGRATTTTSSRGSSGSSTGATSGGKRSADPGSSTKTPPPRRAAGSSATVGTKRYTPPKPRRPVPARQEPEPEPSNRVMSWLRR